MKYIATPRLGIELTQRCNLNCSHCFRGSARNVDISKEIIEKVFEEIKDVNILDLSGGEVFLGYEQLKMILEVAKEKDVIISSCSMIINGTIYDERMYELLDQYFGDNYSVYISDDDFHSKSIERTYGNSKENSENPDLFPKSKRDIWNNMKRHTENRHFRDFTRVSHRLINNGRAIDVQTPHKEFEALGYYYYNISSNALLVGPMIFIGADGYISDINSDINKRKEQSLGNINNIYISDAVFNGGIETKKDEFSFLEPDNSIRSEFFEFYAFYKLMEKRDNDFATHQGDHLRFENGKLAKFEPKIDENYLKAMEGLEDFWDRAFPVFMSGSQEELLEFMNSDYFRDYYNLYPRDLSQIEHIKPDDGHGKNGGGHDKHNNGHGKRDDEYGEHDEY